MEWLKEWGLFSLKNIRDMTTLVSNKNVIFEDGFIVMTDSENKYQIKSQNIGLTVLLMKNMGPCWCQLWCDLSSTVYSSINEEMYVGRETDSKLRL